MPSSDRPTDQDLARLLDRLRPKIIRRLRLSGVPEAEAERMVGEALIGVAYRWDRVRDRERWVLEFFEKEIQRYLEKPEKEPKDG
jgi:hypothetical protein